MDKMIEYYIEKSIERVFQSWFIDSAKRSLIMTATFNYLARIYDIIKNSETKNTASTVELMKLVGLDYNKVCCQGKLMFYNSLEEGVHDSLQYFMASIKENNLI